MLHHVALEKLLMRPPIDFDPAPIKALVAGRRVLVTGAGGSIGSELCRQLAELAPASLVMLDRYENGLHAAIAHVAGRPFVNPVVGDITDAKRLRAIFEQSRPHLVFHAAAHKHVPLMEANPCEAVKNNVTGTRCVAEAAERVKTERFVLISTDKAVRPSSVMGATKRVAELLMDQMTGPGGTAFVTVRFGNVLGSNGSVLPRFLDQINDGGPVTVTHPEMRRYFMLLSEAVHLVLRAAAFDQGPPVCVLDLGDQVRVLDLARYLIRLAGFVPEKEIPIVFTGLRPGEKLSEELVDQDEDLHPSLVKGIFAVRRRDPERPQELGSGLKNLEAMAAADDEQAVIAGLCALVPGFAPGAQWAATSQQRRRMG
jgi:FlaA1/EpsC-like NDP-sugar epimerase